MGCLVGSMPVPYPLGSKWAAEGPDSADTAETSVKATWDICSLPHGPAFGKKEQIVNTVGRMLERATLANGGSPPIGLAYDLHASHETIDQILLGLIPFQ